MMCITRPFALTLGPYLIYTKLASLNSPLVQTLPYTLTIYEVLATPLSPHMKRAKVTTMAMQPQSAVVVAKPGR